MHGAMKMYEIRGADISEVSQFCVAQEAALKEYGGVRFVPGWSLDLTRDDPATGQPWDLSKHSARERVRKLVRDTKPLLLIGSPPPMHNVLVVARFVEAQAVCSQVCKGHERRKGAHQVLR